MLKDLTGEKKLTREGLLEAIRSLKSKGSDINPYSIAAEAGVSRHFIVKSPELLELISQARLAQANNSAPPQAVRPGLDQTVELMLMTDEVASDSNIAANLQLQLKQSQDANLELCEEIDQLKRSVEDLSKSMSLAWQQGYLAGQHAVLAEQESQKAALAQAAQIAQAKAAQANATTHSTTPPPPQPPQQAVPQAVVPPLPQTAAPQPTPEPPPTPVQQAPVPPPLPVETKNVNTEPLVSAASSVAATTAATEPFVADVQLQLDNEEALNDPFTAKLLSALQAEQSIIESEVPNDEVDDEAQEEDEEEFEEDDGDDDEYIEDEDEDEDEGVGPRPGESDVTQTFTADELHNLFRQKYEEQPQAPKEPAVSMTQTKKFVGSKHQSTEPPPNLPRAYPPEIRKACRLLGLTPEDLTRQAVLEAWKREMSKPGVHPDQGGDTEMAIYLNTAKDTLTRWVSDQAPKLGKKFGSKTDVKENSSTNLKAPPKPE